MKRYYVAYGSNLNVEQMTYRCPDAVIFGTAEIPDYRLMFKGSKTGSYLTIEKEEGVNVPVGVWAVSEADEKHLDIYEGYPTFYYKTEMTLSVKNARTGKTSRRKCFVYIMHEDRKLGIPTRRYVEICKQGYKDFGFKLQHLIDAIKFSWEGSK